jgi:hypothetical protein
MFGHRSIQVKARNYYLNKPGIAIRRKSPNATLEVRRCRRYGRKRSGTSGEIPSVSTTRQDFGISAAEFEVAGFRGELIQELQIDKPHQN